MRYLGNYNENGEYIGFYTVEIHGNNIPTPTIVLTENEWKEAITGHYKVVNGKHTYVGQPVANEEEIISFIRQQRNQLLYESDWTQLADSPLSLNKKEEWKLYRQNLRDLPNNMDINNIIFPTPPDNLD